MSGHRIKIGAARQRRRSYFPSLISRMTRKPSSKQDDPEESKRFLEAAKEAGADGWQTAFEEAFTKLDVRKKSAPQKKQDKRTPR